MCVCVCVGACVRACVCLRTCVQASIHACMCECFMTQYTLCILLQSLKPGTLLLGVVKDLQDLEATVSLPFNMQCIVRHSDISDPITTTAQLEVDHEGTGDEEDMSMLPGMSNLFFVGQFVMCLVVERREKKVTVTLNPRLINEGLSPSSIFQGMV